MTPLSKAHLELLVAVQTAEVRALTYKAARLPGLSHAQRDADMLADHRVAVAGDLAEALDGIEPGLGERLMRAMYPEVDVDLEVDIVAAMAAAGVLPASGGAGPSQGQTA